MTTTLGSGYCDCACRDCFEIAIRDEGEEGALCHACEEAGCEPHDGECQAEGAYGGDEELEHDGCLEYEDEGPLHDSGREDFHSDG